MRNGKWLGLLGGTLLVALGWSWPQPKSPSADKPVKVHILYTSDAVGYHEPCG